MILYGLVEMCTADLEIKGSWRGASTKKRSVDSEKPNRTRAEWEAVGSSSLAEPSFALRSTGYCSGFRGYAGFGKMRKKAAGSSLRPSTKGKQPLLN